MSFPAPYRVASTLIVGLCACASTQSVGSGGLYYEAEQIGPVHFHDVTAASGIQTHTARWQLAHSACWGDIDRDGDPDLYVGAFAWRPAYGEPDAPIPNMLFVNNGAGGFDLSPERAVRLNGQRARSSGCVFADLDNDSDLDLLVANHGEKPGQPKSKVFENDGRGRFRDVTPNREPWTLPLGMRNLAVLDVDGDGLLDIIMADGSYAHWQTGGGALLVLRNRGNFEFVEIHETLGFPDRGMVATGLAIGDVNEDGVFDIFVADCNRLFVSRPGGTYREATPGRFTRPGARGKMLPTGAAFGDLDGDGLLDLVYTIHGVPTRLFVFRNRGVKDGIPDFFDISQDVGFDRPWPEEGVTGLPLKSTHVTLADMDNDGRLDIALANVLDLGAGGRQPFVLRNRGVVDGRLQFDTPPMDRLWGYFAPGPVADYDRDGRLDVFLASWWTVDKLPTFLFRNTTRAGHWLTVRVVGRGSGFNTMGVGAIVRVYRAGRAGDPAHLIARRDIAVGTGYSSGEEARAHVGVGRASRVDVVVTWRDRFRAVSRVAVDRELTLAFPSLAPSLSDT